jgi:hypothetical protein
MPSTDWNPQSQQPRGCRPTPILRGHPDRPHTHTRALIHTYTYIHAYVHTYIHAYVQGYSACIVRSTYMHSYIRTYIFHIYSPIHTVMYTNKLVMYWCVHKYTCVHRLHTWTYTVRKKIILTLHSSVRQLYAGYILYKDFSWNKYFGWRQK